MQKYLQILERNPLFRGIESEQLLPMLHCLGAYTNSHKKDSFILMAGDPVRFIGIIVEGSALIIKESAEGDRTIIASLTKGDYFAEALCCAGVDSSPVSVIATSDTVVLKVEYQRIMNICPDSCGFHPRLVENMLQILARKNIFMQNRLEVIGKRTMREKILSYLRAETTKQGNDIIIPLSRQELADFLNVDRSALSHELSRMRDEGIIKFRKNHFTLLR